jgi:hypothetical protein
MGEISRFLWQRLRSICGCTIEWGFNNFSEVFSEVWAVYVRDIFVQVGEECELIIVSGWKEGRAGILLYGGLWVRPFRLKSRIIWPAGDKFLKATDF